MSDSNLHWGGAQGFRPDRRFDVVIGSDLIYYEADAAALAATIVAHTARLSFLSLSLSLCCVCVCVRARARASSRSLSRFYPLSSHFLMRLLLHFLGLPLAALPHPPHLSHLSLALWLSRTLNRTLNRTLTHTLADIVRRCQPRASRTSCATGVGVALRRWLIFFGLRYPEMEGWTLSFQYAREGRVLLKERGGGC